MNAEIVAAVVDRVVTRYRSDPTCMLQILREVQEACDWVSPEAIDCLQERLGVPRTKIEGVAGFYSFIYTEPRGHYRILFSDNITDQMQGNRALIDQLCNSLWVEPGKVSEDGLLSIDKTSCTGMCDQGPALLVNNRASFFLSRTTSARQTFSLPRSSSRATPCARRMRGCRLMVCCLPICGPGGKVCPPVLVVRRQCWMKLNAPICAAGVAPALLPV
jgi:NADH:ubiquinone oxidoreductase subunit E